ncbi:MAG: hypothetical protein K0R57_3659 [Paenibacillaceae bacterium]|jgi:sensor histidine kinase YesM|nr:hypothetical protein [Paenibacillaceae bacterium]
MRQRLREWFRNSSLATKQFIYLVLVFASLFSVLAWNNLRDAEDAVREQVIGDSQIIIDRTNRMLDAYIETIMGCLMLIENSRELLLGDDDYEIRKALNEFSKMSTMVKTLYFIRSDGVVLSNKQGLTEALGNPELLRLASELPPDSYALQWSEPYYSPVSGRTVAFTLPVKDGFQRQVGIAAVEMDLDLIKTRLNEMIGSADQTFAVMTLEKQFVSVDLMSPLIPYVIESYQKKLSPSFTAQLASLSTGVSTVDGAELPLVAVKSASNKLSWSIISLIDERYFYTNIHKLNDNFRQAAIIWGLVLFACVWVMTRLITKPIRKLALKMDRAKDFAVVKPMHQEGSDEIGLLIQSYNRLLTRVHLLLKEVKESEESKKHYELKMLQSQIGPHFLYNTLTCISSLAKQQRTEEVRETIRSLGGLLQYSFNHAAQFVTLGQELEGLRMYVQIQKVRYGDEFEVYFEVPGSLLECRMLKLTLQPLVENAIYHGISARSGGGVIRIAARVEHGVLKLYVMDNGVGMARDCRRPWLKPRSSGSGDREGNGSRAFHSIGLVNVQERIRLHFGTEYGLRIASLPGAGTTVRITLPLQRTGEQGTGSRKDEGEAYGGS